MLLFMGAKIALAQLFSFIFSKMNEAGFISTASTSTLEKFPTTEGPLCFALDDAQSALTELLTTWLKERTPSRLLLREQHIEDECSDHNVLFIKHHGAIQGYLTYRAVGSGTLQELAEDPDSLDVSNYFSRNGQAIVPEDLPERPILNSRQTYKNVAFINKIEALPNKFGYGTALLEALREQTNADLLIVHAVDAAAEMFFERNDFDYPGIYNGFTEPEAVMAWCKPRRKR